MVKPDNCTPALKDKLLNLFVDWSSGLTNTGKPFFVDFEEDYDVVSVTVVNSVAYIASQAVTLSVGTEDGPNGRAANATEFVNAQSLGTAAIAVGVETPVTMTSDKVLPAGTPLTVTCAASASQTGEGIICVRLRPKTRARGNQTKRPGASAQAAT